MPRPGFRAGVSTQPMPEIGGVGKAVEFGVRHVVTDGGARANPSRRVRDETCQKRAPSNGLSGFVETSTPDLGGLPRSNSLGKGLPHLDSNQKPTG